MGSPPPAVHSRTLAPGLLATDTNMFKGDSAHIMETSYSEQFSLSHSPTSVTLLREEICLRDAQGLALYLIPKVIFLLTVWGCTSVLKQAKADLGLPELFSWKRFYKFAHSYRNRHSLFCQPCYLYPKLKSRRKKCIKYMYILLLLTLKLETFLKPSAGSYGRCSYTGFLRRNDP